MILQLSFSIYSSKIFDSVQIHNSTNCEMFASLECLNDESFNCIEVSLSHSKFAKWLIVITNWQGFSALQPHHLESLASAPIYKFLHICSKILRQHCLRRKHRLQSKKGWQYVGGNRGTNPIQSPFLEKIYAILRRFVPKLQNIKGAVKFLDTLPSRGGNVVTLYSQQIWYNAVIAESAISLVL